MALNDQAEMTGKVCTSISYNTELAILDLSGCKNIDEHNMNTLSKGPQVKPNKDPEAPPPKIGGLKKLQVLKLNGLDKVHDNSLMNLCKMNPEL